MNCEQIREAIDSGIQSEAVHGHLTGCPACQQFEAETSSLLSMLSAQPRVKALAAFETQLQARLQTVLASEESKLTALLGSLPVVTAPASFEAQLQARLASKEVNVAALVGALPAIGAPGDFDFRLRARLAQTNAEQAARGPLVWLADFWTKSFSFGPAATAMAALAVVVAFSVTQLKRETAQPNDTSALVAKVEMPKAPATHQLDVPAPLASNQVTPARQTIAVKASTRTNRPLTPAASASSKALATPVDERQLVASNLNEQTVFSSVTRQEMKVSRSPVAYYGQQLAKSVPALKADTLSVAAF
ncbi:MAG: hypothetical protein HYR56_07655 [Acidobacteria bacterium]|nr:hypothetical protein [Acidobacteriota bacterium]MBI3427360.1 hypothetical protein [Acidobacteriota bacterium]